MKAIILFSGGLDSTVLLAKALEEKKQVFLLSFDYGQRHLIELVAAQKIASHYGLTIKTLKLPNDCFRGSSLIGDGEVSREVKELKVNDIPTTYVPARNTLFFAFAMGFAETIDANEIHYGANKLDYNAYPDCRPEFISAFQKVLDIGSKNANLGKPIKLCTPFVHLDKSEIIQLGKKLKAPLELSFSCYSPSQEGLSCQECLSCRLRNEGFKNAD